MHASNHEKLHMHNVKNCLDCVETYLRVLLGSMGFDGNVTLNGSWSIKKWEFELY
jgi:hypothetical protein